MSFLHGLSGRDDSRPVPEFVERTVRPKTVRSARARDLCPSCLGFGRITTEDGMIKDCDECEGSGKER